MVNSSTNVLVGLKLTSKTLQIHDAVSLLIPTTKIFSEGNDPRGIFVLCCIIFRNEIAFKTTIEGVEGGGNKLQKRN